ncbi:MAG: hypothetical protein HFH25_04005 [Lachnospiraceae bacterium]|nr:hypothetical protein [Lachnospiraceae bacterium]
MAANDTNLVIDRLTLGRNAAASLQAQLSRIRNLSVDITQASLSRSAVSEIQAAFHGIRPEIQVQANTKEAQKQAQKLSESLSKILAASGILDPKNVGRCKTSHFNSISMQWI